MTAKEIQKLNLKRGNLVIIQPRGETSIGGKDWLATIRKINIHNCTLQVVIKNYGYNYNNSSRVNMSFIIIDNIMVCKNIKKFKMLSSLC